MNDSSFPPDADGETRQRIADDGSDMSQPMAIDFFVAIPDEKAGQNLAQYASAIGYQTDVSQDKESGEWTCYCAKTMLATHTNVKAAQKELTQLAEQFGGYTDGWGTFRNVDG